MAFLKRWCFTFVDYWKMIGNDYMAVIGDFLEDVRKKPIITTFKLLSLSGAFYAYKTNPTEEYVQRFSACLCAFHTIV